ncbi:biopolymer transport protein ExbD [Sinobacterium caligoides]|uniref:Biopolymer transport protein ExbD n=1 Tax=Sinobacterium caligoides TaxID=933926 RepID=A0A3N2DKF0_9GAMM|nr:biopolymer transporter ExbD [Sinobacterium caligoides]ROS00284.1 biopolymer transport protein ExbD [Sinobacterium caligoides]
MKFKRQSKNDVEVNIAPLIDVVFLLLIFFMVSTTFTEKTHLTLDLPQASGDSGEVKQNIEVAISASGNYTINGRALINQQPNTLKKALAEFVGKDQHLVITADAKTPHQAVVTAMDVAGKLKFVHLSITTRKPDLE